MNPSFVCPPGVRCEPPAGTQPLPPRAGSPDQKGFGQPPRGEPGRAPQPELKGQRPELKGQREEAEEAPQEFLDPREAQNVRREAKRMAGELKRFAGKVKQSQELSAAVQELQAKLGELSAAVDQAERQSDAGELREALRSFYEAELWQDVEKLRLVVELPRELKLIDRELKRVERLIDQKAYQKLGVDPVVLREHLKGLRAAYQEVKAAQVSGDLEATMEALEVFREGGHPGEIASVLQRLRDIRRFTSSVRDADAKAEAEEILAPILEAMNSGDFREARELMDDAFNDLVRHINLVLRKQRQRPVNEEEMDEKFGALQEKIRAKVEKFLEAEERREQNEGRTPTAEPGSATGGSGTTGQP